MEEWKDIEDFEGLYQVSNLGNVKGLKRDKLLKLYENPDGYYRIKLCKNGKHKSIFVHKLVINAFCDKIVDMPEVDHINRIKKDNRIENLRWANRSINTRNVAKKEGLSSKYLGVHLTEYNKWKASICVNKKHLYLGTFETEEEAGLAYDRYIIENIKEFGILNFPDKIK